MRWASMKSTCSALQTSYIKAPVPLFCQSTMGVFAAPGCKYRRNAFINSRSLSARPSLIDCVLPEIEGYLCCKTYSLSWHRTATQKALVLMDVLE